MTACCFPAGRFGQSQLANQLVSLCLSLRKAFRAVERSRTPTDLLSFASMAGTGRVKSCSAVACGCVHRQPVLARLQSPFVCEPDVPPSQTEGRRRRVDSKPAIGNRLAEAPQPEEFA